MANAALDNASTARAEERRALVAKLRERRVARGSAAGAGASHEIDGCSGRSREESPHAAAAAAASGASASSSSAVGAPRRVLDAAEAPSDPVSSAPSMVPHRPPMEPSERQSRLQAIKAKRTARSQQVADRQSAGDECGSESSAVPRPPGDGPSPAAGERQARLAALRAKREARSAMWDEPIKHDQLTGNGSMRDLATADVTTVVEKGSSASIKAAAALRTVETELQHPEKDEPGAALRTIEEEPVKHGSQRSASPFPSASQLQECDSPKSLESAGGDASRDGRRARVEAMRARCAGRQQAQSRSAPLEELLGTAASYAQQTDAAGVHEVVDGEGVAQQKAGSRTAVQRRMDHIRLSQAAREEERRHLEQESLAASEAASRKRHQELKSELFLSSQAAPEENKSHVEQESSVAREADAVAARSVSSASSRSRKQKPRPPEICTDFEEPVQKRRGNKAAKSRAAPNDTSDPQPVNERPAEERAGKIEDVAQERAPRPAEAATEDPAKEKPAEERPPVEPEVVVQQSVPALAEVSAEGMREAKPADERPFEIQEVAQEHAPRPAEAATEETLDEKSAEERPRVEQEGVAQESAPTLAEAPAEESLETQAGLGATEEALEQIAQTFAEAALQEKSAEETPPVAIEAVQQLAPPPAEASAEERTEGKPEDQLDVEDLQACIQAARRDEAPTQRHILLQQLKAKRAARDNERSSLEHLASEAQSSFEERAALDELQYDSLGRSRSQSRADSRAGGRRSRQAIASPRCDVLAASNQDTPQAYKRSSQSVDCCSERRKIPAPVVKAASDDARPESSESSYAAFRRAQRQTREVTSTAAQGVADSTSLANEFSSASDIERQLRKQLGGEVREAQPEKSRVDDRLSRIARIHELQRARGAALMPVQNVAPLEELDSPQKSQEVTLTPKEFAEENVSDDGGLIQDDEYGAPQKKVIVLRSDHRHSEACSGEPEPELQVDGDQDALALCTMPMPQMPPHQPPDLFAPPEVVEDLRHRYKQYLDSDRDYRQPQSYHQSHAEQRTGSEQAERKRSAKDDALYEELQSKWRELRGGMTAEDIRPELKALMAPLEIKLDFGVSAPAAASPERSLASKKNQRKPAVLAAEAGLSSFSFPEKPADPLFVRPDELPRLLGEAAAPHSSSPSRPSPRPSPRREMGIRGASPRRRGLASPAKTSTSSTVVPLPSLDRGAGSAERAMPLLGKPPKDRQRENCVQQ